MVFRVTSRLCRLFVFTSLAGSLGVIVLVVSRGGNNDLLLKSRKGVETEKSFIRDTSHYHKPRRDPEHNKCDPVDPTALEEVERIQEERKRQIKEVCAKYPKKQPNRPYRHLLVDDRHRMLFCPIPKVGCTNWKRMLIRLSDNYHGNPNRRIHVHKHGTMHKYGIRHLSEYPPEERQWRLQNYSTFMFARNPYERTLSGYRNKMLEREWWFIRKYGRQIKRRFRGSQKGGRVRFDEFVRYLIKLDQNDGNFNMHWAKYHTICHPCEIDYDYIGKMETMNADADYIIRKFYGWRCPPKFPQKKGGHKTTNKVTSRWYSNLTQPLIDGLYKVYEKDFKLFGYDKIPPKI